MIGWPGGAWSQPPQGLPLGRSTPSRRWRAAGCSSLEVRGRRCERGGGPPDRYASAWPLPHPSPSCLLWLPPPRRPRWSLPAGTDGQTTLGDSWWLDLEDIAPPQPDLISLADLADASSQPLPDVVAAPALPLPSGKQPPSPIAAGGGGGAQQAPAFPAQHAQPAGQQQQQQQQQAQQQQQQQAGSSASGSTLTGGLAYLQQSLPALASVGTTALSSLRGRLGLPANPSASALAATAAAQQQAASIAEEADEGLLELGRRALAAANGGGAAGQADTRQAVAAARQWLATCGPSHLRLGDLPVLMADYRRLARLGWAMLLRCGLGGVKDDGQEVLIFLLLSVLSEGKGQWAYLPDSLVPLPSGHDTHSVHDTHSMPSRLACMPAAGWLIAHVKSRPANRPVSKPLIPSRLPLCRAGSAAQRRSQSRGCRCRAASCTCQQRSCACGRCQRCWQTISSWSPPMPRWWGRQPSPRLRRQPRQAALRPRGRGPCSDMPRARPAPCAQIGTINRMNTLVLGTWVKLVAVLLC